MKTPTALETLHWAQHVLEDFYGARTCLDVRDFVRTLPDFRQLGRLHVEQDAERGDIDLALFLDRDIFSAWQSHVAVHRAAGVLCEEVSHFVYLGFNHRRRRNISPLEMELQSEIDRIVLAYHPSAPSGVVEHRDALLEELRNKRYDNGAPESYEQARRWASRLVDALRDGDPKAWGPEEEEVLRAFFHRDLSEKIHLLRKVRK